MPPPLLQNVFSTGLPAHCEPTSPFLSALSSYLNICLPTPLALLSSVLGTLSIISWLFAQLPQIYKNYQLKSTSGLSLFFLVEWCLGDAGNLLGALFTRQATWQVIIAGYYVLVDITLVFQFFWYTHYKGRRDVYIIPHSQHGDDPAAFLEGLSLSEESSVSSVTSPKPTPEQNTKDVDTLKESTSNSPSPSYSTEKVNSPRRFFTRARTSPSLPLASTRTILLASMLCAVVANAKPTELDPNSPAAAHEANLEAFGRICSWISTVLYLGSRPPQLYKNYLRRSTSGLSPLLFMAAFSGNFFYSTSLLTNPNAWYDFPPYGGGGWADAGGNNRAEWVTLAIPFFLGAFGVLFLDGSLGVQFLMYRSSDEEQVVRVEDPERGSRWTRVSGWMRGWIPSVSPERGYLVDPVAQEGQGLLEEDRRRYGTV